MNSEFSFLVPYYKSIDLMDMLMLIMLDTWRIAKSSLERLTSGDLVLYLGNKEVELCTTFNS